MQRLGIHLSKPTAQSQPALDADEWWLPQLARTLDMPAVTLYDWVRRPLGAYLGEDPLTPDALQHFREHCLFTPEDLAFLLGRAGFEVAEVIGRHGGNYAIVVARKPLEQTATSG